MLDRDIFVLEPLGLALGRHQQAGEALGDEDLARFRPRAGNSGPLVQLGFDLLLQLLRPDVHPLQQAWHQAVGLIQQRPEKVLAFHFHMTVADRLALRLGQRFL